MRVKPPIKQPGMLMRTTHELRGYIIEAMKQAGGGGKKGAIKYLKERALGDPEAFMQLLGKLIPKETVLPVDMGDVSLEALIRASNDKAVQAAAAPAAAPAAALPVSAPDGGNQHKTH